MLPVSVLVGRSNTPDALVSALTLLAAWLIVRYVESGSTRFLYLAAMVVGLSFEVKLFEGLLAVPALIVLYGLASRGALRARPRQVTAALSLFLVVALAWPTAVSLAPSSSRPYAIGSTDGSVWSAFFIYNGLDRLDPAGPAVAMLTAPQWLRRSGNTPGPLRLFQLGGRQFGRTIGVELAPALVFGAIALSLGLLAELRRRASGRSPPTLPKGWRDRVRGLAADRVPRSEPAADRVFALRRGNCASRRGRPRREHRYLLRGAR